MRVPKMAPYGLMKSRHQPPTDWAYIAYCLFVATIVILVIANVAG